MKREVYVVTKLWKLEDSVCRDATPGAVSECDNEMGDVLLDVLPLPPCHMFKMFESVAYRGNLRAL